MINGLWYEISQCYLFIGRVDRNPRKLFTSILSWQSNIDNRLILCQLGWKVQSLLFKTFHTTNQENILFAENPHF